MPHIYADPNAPIGNRLAINLRQKSSLSFVQISRTSSESVLSINGCGIAVGTYELVIESFDDLSIAKSTLMTDRIEIHISGKEVECVLNPSKSFQSQLRTPIFKFGLKTTWSLPITAEGTILEFSPDLRIDSLFRFDSITRTITFNGQELESAEAFVNKVFFNSIRLI